MINYDEITFLDAISVIRRLGQEWEAIKMLTDLVRTDKEISDKQNAEKGINMARYIDADALIEDFNNDVHCLRLGGMKGTPRPLEIALKNVIERIEETPTADVVPRGEWISVDEALPAKDGDYITFTNATGESNGVIAMRFVTTTVRGQKIRRWEWRGRISPWKVTHWMPLPEAPKMRKEDEGK